MQTDHRVPNINTTAMRQQYRKRSYSNSTFRKRDRHDLMCVVCHAPAMGYNFDQITCESCKAFFRRNALNNNNKFKCRSGTNDCIVTLQTRKRCKYCRLKQCFDKGLRKEWIMSEDEKRSKKQKIEDNRRLRALSQSLSQLTSTASIQPDHHSNENSSDYVRNECDDDSNDFKYSVDCKQQIQLKQIEEHYDQAVKLNTSVIRGCDSPCMRYLSDHIECINEPAQISSLRLITFFKLTPEFNSLNEDDRLLLVKHNAVAILYLHFCICTDLTTGIFHEPNTLNDYGYDVKVLRSYSDDIYHETLKFTGELQAICSNDHLILKLLILIALFSKGSDTYETCLHNTSQVYSCQNIFVQLLIDYLNVRFGIEQCSMVYSRLVFSLLKCQSLGRETKMIAANKTNQVDELAPLMQSVFQISS